MTASICLHLHVTIHMGGGQTWCEKILAIPGQV